MSLNNISQQYPFPTELLIIAGKRESNLQNCNVLPSQSVLNRCVRFFVRSFLCSSGCLYVRSLVCPVERSIVPLLVRLFSFYCGRSFYRSSFRCFL